MNRKQQAGKKKTGIVYLTGAGPWDPGLLTMRGAALLSAADAVVYDRLVNPELLSLAHHAENYYVGKHTAHRKPSCKKMQDEINQLLVRLAREGKMVVRLKGGDPLLFGRGGEEATHLRKKGIRFEMVPGVTAGLAAPAYAGIPVTDRRYASALTFVTAHEELDRKDQQVDWEQISRLKGTVVVFMGVRNLAKIVRRFLGCGRPQRTKVTVIERASHSDQRVVEGTLRNIVSKVKGSRIKPPAVIVFGEVNRFRKELSWFRGKHRIEIQTKDPAKPLRGKTVLVTRAAAQASSLKESLMSKGAQVIEFPVIKIAPPRRWDALDRVLKKIQTFDWIVFTSANAVYSVFSRIHHKNKDSRAFAGVKIAAIGKATRAALETYGIRADLMPDQFTTRALVKKLHQKGWIKHRRYLLPRTDIAPDYLKEELMKKGAEVTQVVAYRTLLGSQAKARKGIKKYLKQKRIDYVTFTSSSTVENFLKAVPQGRELGAQTRYISIGPVTTRTLKEHGIKPHREAKSYTVSGLVEEMVHDR